MNIVSLAARNILRNRRRSLTTISAMTLGVVTVLMFGGFSRDIGYTLETGYVQRGGHLQLQRKDYFMFGSGNPGGYGIAGYQNIIKELKADPVLGPKLVVATPILQMGGVAGNFANGLSKTVLITGMDIEGQNALHHWNDYGTFQKPKISPLTDTAEDATLIGVGVARVLQICDQLQIQNCPKPAPRIEAAKALPSDIASLSLEEAQLRPAQQDNQPGARLELLAANTNGAPNVTGLHVVKAEPQGTKELDDIYVAMHLGQAQHLLYGSQEPKATAIVMQFRHTSDLNDAKARLNELIALGKLGGVAQPLEMRDFTEIFPFHRQATLMFQTIFGFIAILIGSIVLFTVSNTMSMAVVERTVEIGTLRAMGQRRSGIRRLFVVEGVILGIAGAAVGVAASLLIAGAVNNSGVTWTPPGWSNTVPFVVRVWGETRLIAMTAVSIAIVAAVSAWWPARRAAKLNVVEALRHV